MVCSHGRLGRSSEKDKRLRRRATFLIPIALLAPPASAQLVPFPATAGQVVFITPSMNIQCTFMPARQTGTYFLSSSGPELSCDRFGPRYLRFVLGPIGPAHLFSVVADEDCCGADNMLDFGMTWSEEPFTCRSAQKGLGCNREGHGFYISKTVVLPY